MNSNVENVISELESVGAIGRKVVPFKPRAIPTDATPDHVVAEERAQLAEQRAHLAEVAEIALKKLEAVIEAVQDLQTTFQELHEATREGEDHAEVHEEA